MKALLHIRLKKILLHPIRNFLIYYIHTLVLILAFIVLLYFNDFNFSKIRNITQEIGGYDYSTTSIFGKDSKRFPSYLAVICNDTELSQKFVDVINDTYREEGSYWFLNAKIFRSLEELYKEDRFYSYSKIFLIEGTAPKNLTFSELNFNNYKYKSYDESQNLLSFGYDSIWPDKIYFNLITNFMKNITSIEDNTIINFSEGSYRVKLTNFFSFYQKTILIIPYALSFTHVFIILYFLFWMIEEKELKLDTFLKRQGVGHYNYILSWFLSYMIMTFPPMVLTTILLSVCFWFKHFILLFLFLFLFECSIFASALFFHTLIDKVKTASTIMKLLIVCLFGFSFVLVQDGIPLYVKLIFSLFPQVLIVLNLQVLISLDNFDSIDFKLWTVPYQNYSLLTSFISYIVMIAVNILLALFIMNYRESGLDMISYIKSIFTKVDRKLEERVIDDQGDDIKIDTKPINHQEISAINQEKKNHNDYLSIRNVTRIYGQLRAVNNLCGEIYGGEIFCLLGHNGAGKTTLIKMISGLEDPDSGDIFLGATSLVTNKKFLYRNIGLCSQEDIFFEYLTVNQHLQLMSELKGAKANMQEIDDLITKIDLVEKKNALCSTLSGGQKRKLCVALALIGNSKLILLDEPSSGMDPIAKRQLWKFLKGYKSNKIIILTTHSLDEAEYLGDRIGIMSEGVYLCSGTSSYLKSKYPCGYNINCIINPLICTSEKKKELLSQLKEIDNTAEIRMMSKAIVSINFSGIGEIISQVFKHLDEIKQMFGIESYTVSTTTLEDVFLKLNNGSNSMFSSSETQSKNNDEITINATESISSSIDIRPSYPQASFISQLSAHFHRYLITLLRNKSNYFLEIFSAIFLLLFFIFGFSHLLTSSINKEPYNYNKLLTGNPIYYKIDPELKDTILKSQYYSNLIGSNFQEYPYDVPIDTISIQDLQSLYQTQSKHKIDRDILIIRKNKKNQIDVLNLYNPIAYEFVTAVNNLIISAIFEDKYKIYLDCGSEIKMIPSSYSNNKAYENMVFIAVISVIILGLSILSFARYIMIEPLKERLNNLKQMMSLSGANLFSYWIGMYIVDVIKFLIFVFIMLPLFLVNSVKEVQYSYIFIVFIPFILSMVIVCYCYTFRFSKIEEGQKSFVSSLIFITFILFIITGIRFAILERLGFYKDDSPMEMFYGRFTFFEGDFFPTSSLIIAVFKLFVYGFVVNEEIDAHKKLFSRGMIVLNHTLIFLGQCVIYSGLLVLLEKRIIGNWWNSFLNSVSFSKDSSSDLSQEGLRQGLLQQGNYYTQKEISKINSGSNLTVIIRNLKKTYWVCCGKNVRAVNRLYLGLEANEKFGLLGFNGSGKTTTFQCIANEIFYDEGTITLHGLDTKENFDMVRKFIGYCPQENALFTHFTVYDTLFFYCQLKGVKEPVEDIAERYGLGKYLKTVCTKLSGGNKRKLIFAIALMNNPKMLLLDEPSTGVDPESRRVMWKNINRLERTNPEYNMILSTHSMEEAEILCDTVSWLKKGNFVCIGNPEKLKLQFSAGYHLHVKFNQVEQGEVLDSNKIVTELNLIVNNLQGLNNVMMMYPNIISYYDLLYKALLLIKDNCDSIALNQVGDDMSFELIIKIRQGKEGEVFYTVLNMKNINDTISEVNISMESLENVLTFCENSVSVLGV